MSKKEEALKLALPVLERMANEMTVGQRYTNEGQDLLDALFAIREARAEQPAQQDQHEFPLRGILASELKCWHRLTEDEAQNLVAFVQNMPAKPAQQEPVACFSVFRSISGERNTRFLELASLPDGEHYFYTSPPASKPWVGLTDEDRALCVQATVDSGDAVQLMRALEAKLREKNA